MGINTVTLPPPHPTIWPTTSPSIEVVATTETPSVPVPEPKSELFEELPALEQPDRSIAPAANPRITVVGVFGFMRSGYA